MASVVRFARVTKRVVHSIPARRFSFARVTLAGDHHAASHIPGDPKDKADLNGVTGKIPSEVEQSTGRERLELNALLAGHDDPYGMGGARVVAKKGTLASPTKVPSHLDSRLVGCCCNPEAEVIMWLNVTRGQPAHCSCGHVYELVDAAAEVSH